MTHLTDRELSARLDDALTPRERERVDTHLSSCAACRDALAALASQDRELAAQRAHDPGEAYFESFAARVENRLRASGLAGAQARPDRGGAWGWLHSPRALALVGVAAALVAGAGVVMMTGREVEMENLHRSGWSGQAPRGAERADKKAEIAPAPPVDRSAPAAKDELERDKETNAPRAATGAPPAAAGAPPTARVQEVKRDQFGEEVLVPGEKRLVNPAPAPAAAPAPPEGTPVVVQKQRRAEPMAGAPQTAAGAQPSESPKSAGAAAPSAAAAKPLEIQKNAEGVVSDRLAAREGGGAVRRCGAVRDPAGRAIAGAQVIVAETGTSVTSAADGSFCIDVPPAGRTLLAMAVGFESRITSLAANERESVALTLNAVPVVGSGLAIRSGATEDVAKLGTREQAGSTMAAHERDTSQQAVSGGTNVLGYASGAAAPHAQAKALVDPFAAAPDSVRTAVAMARILDGEAAQANSAGRYETAALAWEHAQRMAATGPLANEAAYRVAEGRRRAWQLDPTRERAAAALGAAAAFLQHAPAGARRDEATRWLDSLEAGAAGATQH